MNNKLLLYILGGVLGLALVIAIAVSAVTSGGESGAEFGEVTVEGDPIPIFSGEPAGDNAIGMTAPTVTGETFDGETISIAPDGNPKVVLFLAHWCPHCQAEVPRVAQWLEAGNKPEGVDLYAISTLANRVQANWPPSAWLEDEGWDVPTIKDDENSTASQALGLRGTPYWLVLNGDNEVVFRISGEITAGGMDVVDALFQTALEDAA
jgi:thiol-disulfide isomerase/thioredoxin